MSSSTAAGMPRPTAFGAMITQPRGERALSGEGGIDLAAMLRVLPPDIPLSLECSDQVSRARHVGAGPCPARKSGD